MRTEVQRFGNYVVATASYSKRVLLFDYVRIVR